MYYHQFKTNRKMKRILFCLFFLPLFFSCDKTESYTDSLLNEQGTFDYYPFVERVKIETYNSFFARKDTVKIKKENTFNSDLFYRSKSKSNINKLVSVNGTNSPLPDLLKSDELNLSLYNLMTEEQLDLVLPLVNSVILNPDDFSNIESLIENFDMTVSQSNIFSIEEKALLAQLSGEMQITLDFLYENKHNLSVADVSNGIYVMYIDETPNFSTKCKVDMGSVWRGAVLGFFAGGVGGAKLGCIGGTIALPGIGTATGCVGGAVFGATKGFLSSAVLGIAAELLGSCFKGKEVPTISQNSLLEEDIVLTFEVEEEMLPAKLYFPEEYVGRYFYTTSPDFINPANGPKYSTFVYGHEGKYFFNMEKTCILPEGYYFSNQDDKVYHVVSGGEIESVNSKPSKGGFVGGAYPIEADYTTPFDCTPAPL